MESNILHETDNLYLYRAPERLEIRLQGATHSVLVGWTDSEEKARRTMERMESHIEQVRRAYSHY